MSVFTARRLQNDRWIAVGVASPVPRYLPAPTPPPFAPAALVAHPALPRVTMVRVALRRQMATHVSSRFCKAT